jgi:hypothetical protein
VGKPTNITLFFLDAYSEMVGFIVTPYKNLGVNAMNNSKSLFKIIIALVICLYFTAYAYGGTCIEGNCTNGQGTYTYAEGDKYVGEYEDDKRNGQETITYAEGDKYVGEFKDGKRNGQGTLTLTGGTKYVGEHKDDKFNGQGTLTFPDGAKYVGDWKDGKHNGRGTKTTPEGAKYVGDWKDDKFNGQGTLTFPDGAKYVGDWKDGKHNGRGTKTTPEGAKYVGEHKDGKFNGQGTYTFPEGAKYVGDWKDDKFNGQGTLTWPEGAKYVGDWKDDKFNGQGTLTFPEGAKYVGDWKDGKFNGQGTYTWPEGAKYVGGFKDGKKHGLGTLTYANGGVEQGIWENDILVNANVTKSTGTGFAITKDGLIVTACHLVPEDASSIKIHLNDGSTVKATIHTRDPLNDLAILKVNRLTPNYLSIAPLRSTKTGDRVFTIGFPMSSLLGQEAKYTEGVISSVSGIKGVPSFFQISVPIQPGNSGGPLVNEEGFVVGIVSSSAAILPFIESTGTLPQNINWAVKADYLRLLIDLPKPLSASVNREEIIEQTKKASFLIETVN